MSDFPDWAGHYTDEDGIAMGHDGDKCFCYGNAAVPHICGYADCPGNLLRIRLEILDMMADWVREECDSSVRGAAAWRAKHQYCDQEWEQELEVANWGRELLAALAECRKPDIDPDWGVKADHCGIEEFHTRQMLEAADKLAAACEVICKTIHGLGDVTPREVRCPWERQDRIRGILNSVQCIAAAACNHYNDAKGATE